MEPCFHPNKTEMWKRLSELTFARSSSSKKRKIIPLGCAVKESRDKFKTYVYGNINSARIP